MDSAKKCLELLDTKLWLIDFEIDTTTTIICNERCSELISKRRSLRSLRSKLIDKYSYLKPFCNGR